MADSKGNLGGRLLHVMLVVLGGAIAASACFLVLPLIQAITALPPADTELRSIDTASLEPPPPAPEPEKQEEEEKEEKPPELDEAPLDLSQLELALNPGMSGGWMSGNFTIKVDGLGTGGQKGASDSLFSLADLDQKPRAVYQPSPVLDAKMRGKGPATVYIVFTVGTTGKVESATVQKSNNPVFNRAALTAVKKWKFQPGKRKGKSVRFNMRVPITFPRG